MTGTEVPCSESRVSDTVRASTWRPAHYLALVGFLFLVWEAATLLTWLAAGPSPVTEGRDPDSLTWLFARIFEAQAIVIAFGAAIFVVRGCRRERHLTFDAKLVIAGVLVAWTDAQRGFLQPIFFYSSNWTNLESWASHMPGYVNPAPGLMPEPVLYNTISYSFGFLIFAVLIGAVMRRIERSWPSISKVQLGLCSWVVAMALDIAFEVGFYWTGLWAFPGGGPDRLSFWGGTPQKYPFMEFVVAGAAFVTPALLRHHRDTDGNTLVERGLERYAPRVRTAISTLALVGLMSLVLTAANSCHVLNGFYCDPWPELPQHLLLGTCGEGSAYGPCPGSPGFRMPVRLPL